jgi:hypothetical protein
MLGTYVGIDDILTVTMAKYTLENVFGSGKMICPGQQSHTEQMLPRTSDSFNR